jgi:RNA polymerase II subunit A small phosphatase-like protein
MELFASTEQSSAPARWPCCAKADAAIPSPEAQSRDAFPTGPIIPAPEGDDARKICLILDLDETLIHSSFAPISNPDLHFTFGPEDSEQPVFVLVRPGARQFLCELGDLYELIIFTASVRPYADRVVDFIDPGHVVKFRLYRDSCTDFGGSFVKDLSRLSRKLERIIIIDNTPSAYVLHPYNAIPILSWFDDPEDKALFQLLYLLKNSYRVRNVYDLLGSQ